MYMKAGRLETAMSGSSEGRRPQGQHFYRSVVDGMGMANEFLASRLGMSEFARQKGISYAMVKYWVKRARELSQASSAPLAPGADSGSVARGLIEVASVSASGEVGPPTAAMEPPVRVASTSSPPAAASAIEVRLRGGVSIAVGAGFAPEVLRAVVSCLIERERPC